MLSRCATSDLHAFLTVLLGVVSHMPLSEGALAQDLCTCLA